MTLKKRQEDVAEDREFTEKRNPSTPFGMTDCGE